MQSAVEFMGLDKPLTDRERRNRQLRLQRFNEAQAKLPPDHPSRLENISNEKSRKGLDNATLEIYKRAMNSFIDFTETQLSKSVGKEGHGLSYFHEKGPLPDVVTIKQWLRYLVQSRDPVLDGPRLRTAVSVKPSKGALLMALANYNSELCFVLCHFNREWDLASSRDINHWIFTVLAVEVEGLSRVEKAKPTAM